jgi:hypothetical protein
MREFGSSHGRLADCGPILFRMRFVFTTLILAISIVWTGISAVISIVWTGIRGVTRDVTRAQPLKEKFDTIYGQGMMEVVEVVDASLPDAYTQVLHGGPYPVLPITLRRRTLSDQVVPDSFILPWT